MKTLLIALSLMITPASACELTGSISDYMDCNDEKRDRQEVLDNQEEQIDQLEELQEQLEDLEATLD